MFAVQFAFQNIMHSIFLVLNHPRCEVWCPSGSDDDCPENQLCFAFSQCHAVDMNATTLEQQTKAQATVIENGSGIGNTTSPLDAGNSSNVVGASTPPTMGPTNKPSLSAEQAMHRNSFCGKFWDDVSGIKILMHWLNELPFRLGVLQYLTIPNHQSFKRQEIIAKQTSTVRTTMTALKMSFVGQKLLAISTLPKLPQLNPWQKI